MRLILAERKAEYFSRDIWTGVIDLKAWLKLAFLAQVILRPRPMMKAARQTTVELIRARRANHDPSPASVRDQREEHRYTLPLPETYTTCGKRHREVPSFRSIGTILSSRPSHSQCRRAQRRSRMARLRATASVARSVLDDGREHGGALERVGAGNPRTNQPSNS
jgi:hypothetical protein